MPVTCRASLRLLHPVLDLETRVNMSVVLYRSPRNKYYSPQIPALARELPLPDALEIVAQMYGGTAHVDYSETDEIEAVLAGPTPGELLWDAECRRLRDELQKKTRQEVVIKTEWKQCVIRVGTTVTRHDLRGSRLSHILRTMLERA